MFPLWTRTQVMHTSRGSLTLTEGWVVLPLWFVQHTGSILRWYWFSHGHVIGSQERHWQALSGAFMSTYGNNRSSMIFLDLHNDDFDTTTLLRLRHHSIYPQFDDSATLSKSMDIILGLGLYWAGVLMFFRFTVFLENLMSHEWRTMLS